ncbi:MAG: hypothetical protein SAJ12_15315, partial [Jaaginema sp. PMC 1079.18]|nr:hypothetical protein [Jaaginema sp. PMC 1079.18]MEC4865522.1 hypothetical protein [Jaaginema sp. PMC 1078.18]
MARKNRKAPTPSSKRKSKVGISLSSSAVDNLSHIAKETGLSRSALVERLMGGEIAILPSISEIKVTFNPGKNDTDSITPEQIAVVNLENGQVPETDSDPEPETAADSTPDDRIVALQAEVERLTQQLETQHQATKDTDIDQSLEAPSQELDNLTQQLEKQKQAYQTLEQEIEAKNKGIADLTQQLEAKSQEARSLQQEVGNLTQQLDKDSQQNQGIQQEIS